MCTSLASLDMVRALLSISLGLGVTSGPGMGGGGGYTGKWKKVPHGGPCSTFVNGSSCPTKKINCNGAGEGWTNSANRLGVGLGAYNHCEVAHTGHTSTGESMQHTRSAVTLPWGWPFKPERAAIQCRSGAGGQSCWDPTLLCFFFSHCASPVVLGSKNVTFRSSVSSSSSPLKMHSRVHGSKQQQ